MLPGDWHEKQTEICSEIKWKPSRSKPQFLIQGKRMDTHCLRANRLSVLQTIGFFNAYELTCPWWRPEQV